MLLGGLLGGNGHCSQQSPQQSVFPVVPPNTLPLALLGDPGLLNLATSGLSCNPETHLERHPKIPKSSPERKTHIKNKTYDNICDFWVFFLDGPRLLHGGGWTPSFRKTKFFGSHFVAMSSHGCKFLGQTPVNTTLPHSPFRDGGKMPSQALFS